MYPFEDRNMSVSEGLAVCVWHSVFLIFVHQMSEWKRSMTVVDDLG